MLQRVLRGRITFTPRDDRNGYDFTCPTRFDKLFSGVVSPRPTFLLKDDLRGTAGITPADTCDADYGRLLERAYDRICGKGGRPQRHSFNAVLDGDLPAGSTDPKLATIDGADRAGHVDHDSRAWNFHR